MKIIKIYDKQKSQKLFDSGKYEFMGMVITNTGKLKTPYWEYKLIKKKGGEKT